MKKIASSSRFSRGLALRHDVVVEMKQVSDEDEM